MFVVHVCVFCIWLRISCSIVNALTRLVLYIFWFHFQMIFFWSRQLLLSYVSGGLLTVPLYWVVIVSIYLLLSIMYPLLIWTIRYLWKPKILYCLTSFLYYNLIESGKVSCMITNYLWRIIIFYLHIWTS